MFLVDLLRGLLGLAAIIGMAVLLSRHRSRINWRTVAAGLLLQILLAVLILKGDVLGDVFAPLGWPKAFFSWVSSFFVLVLEFTTEGAAFVFGDLAISPGQDGSLGSFFAFQVLPTIIFFSSLMSILYYLGIMQRIVSSMAWLVRRVLHTSGAESLSVTANIFVGQTEAPLVVRPYLSGMTKSELMAVMTGGMATIAGGVMAAYIQMLGDAFAQAQGIELEAARLAFAEQLLGASLMAAPAALLLAKIMIPETRTPETSGRAQVAVDQRAKNVIDAAAIGAGDGLKLALNVGAMLIAFIALIAMGNYIVGWVAGLFGADLTLQQLFGWALAPVAWLIGVPWADAVKEALGRRIERDGRSLRVVGVVGDVEYRRLGEVPEPFVYVAHAQQGPEPAERMNLFVRAEAGAPPAAPEVRQVVRELAPSLPLPEVIPLRRFLGIAFLPQRVAGVVSAILGAIGLGLAGLGLYGLMAFTVSQRVREIGIRMALGSSRRRVLRLVLGRALGLTAAGVAAGGLLALAAAQGLSSMLFGVPPADPVTFVGVALVLLGTAIVGSWVPARRASRVDPMDALRSG